MEKMDTRAFVISWRCELINITTFHNRIRVYLRLMLKMKYLALILAHDKNIDI